MPKALECGKKSLPTSLATPEGFLPDGFSPFGLEKPSGNFFQRDRLSTSTTLALLVTFDFGLLLQPLGKQRTSDGIADFPGLFLDLDELRPPGRRT